MQNKTYNFRQKRSKYYVTNISPKNDGTYLISFLYAAAKVSTSLADTTFWTSKEVYDGNAEMKGKRLPVAMNAFGESLCTPDRNRVMACWAAVNTPTPTAVELWNDSRGRESGSSGVGRGLNDAAGR